MVFLYLAFPLLVAVAASETMVCSKFGYNWAAEIRCLRALLSQCKRSASNREVRKVPSHWNEYSNNFISLDIERRSFPVVQTSTTTTTTTSPPPVRAREDLDVARIIANLTEHFENRLRRLKEFMQLEQQERIAALQSRFENELRISETKAERKFSDFKRKHESEIKSLTKRLDLVASRVFNYKDMEYIFVQDRKSWYEAEEDCLSWGGHLASIRDDHENTFVRGILQAESAWIGINDVQVENFFVNSDQTPVIYKNFQEGEPDNSSHNENCVAMEASGEWADEFCLVTKPYVCKR